MKTRTHTTNTYTHTLKDGTELELELPTEPDGIMDYKDVLAKETADTLVIGYLAHDDDCANPLEDDEYAGSIYEARRHGATLKDYERALGLADGGRNLELVDEDDVVKRALELIELDPDLMAAALTHCDKHFERCAGETDWQFVFNSLDSINELEPVVNVYDIQNTLWQEGREAGTIGDPHAVMLDVYEHGLISYSVSGGGMQDRFDTARGGAVWVPSDLAREEILRRAVVYLKGDVNKINFGGETWYEVSTFSSPGLAMHSLALRFENWYDAYQHLKQLEVVFQRDQVTAERIAARELAASDAENYTDWRNGNCFRTVVATYSLPDGDLVDEDTCGGFIGDDYAYASLKNDYFPKEPA